MISASEDIFSKLEEVLEINIDLSKNSDGFNNLVIAQSTQANSSGFSYFQIITISLDLIFLYLGCANPYILPSGFTNYDYEVLLHEIGHALDQHPFESDRNNSVF